MLRIRALNESHSSSESEDEENPRLSKEAQESQALGMYHEALKFKKQHGDLQALETFEKILALAYLDEEENRNLSPMQSQLQLGCLKCLSSLYSEGVTKNLHEALKIFRLITALEPNNVNYWYRYGKVALENEDLYLSSDCFRRVIQISPGHWGSIDKLVTVSYALHDLFGCLQFCAMGLNKDAGFEKGRVFSDYILTMNPWVKENLLETEVCGFESLFPFEKLKVYDSCRKAEYLNEARNLMKRFRDQQKVQRQQEEEQQNSAVNCPFPLSSISFLELCRCVVSLQEYVQNCGTLLRPVDLSGILSNLVKTDENGVNSFNDTCVNGGDEKCQPPSILRSRSSSDDKEAAVQSDRDQRTSNGNSRVGDGEDKSGEEDSQASNLHIPGQTGSNSADEETCQKKKSRKGMKWWQMEGKRRSQRVRGNLTPISPTKPKAECFLDTLKNVIPGTLICEDSSAIRDELKPSRKDRSSNISYDTYFGTRKEAEDVIDFVSSLQGCNVITVTSKLLRLLSKQCKGQWPLGLGSIFLELYNFYRSTVSVPNDSEFNEEMEYDAFISLTRAELVSESMSVETSLDDYLRELQLNNRIPPIAEEYSLRKNWLLVKHLLQQCKTNTTDYEVLDLGLNYLFDVLSSKPKEYVCFCATQEDSVIASAVILEKINFVGKKKNLSKINELYQSKDYSSLVDLLEFSLIGGDDTCADVKNRLYLAESYYHLKKIDCVDQCAKIAEHGIKNRSDELLAQCISLLKNIVDELLEILSIKEYKLLINVMVQILAYVEKRNVTNELLITEPWCLLSSILFYLEAKEPAFYMEEDSVPNSVLVLQLGHETLSANGKCCASEGKFLSHTMDVLLKLHNDENYWSYEETKNCFEQAVLCLYSHPSKKYKSRNLKDHGAPGVSLNWGACCQLYKYYKLEEIPEFDTYGSISAEVENLFNRIVQEVPENLKPARRFVEIKNFVEGSNSTKPNEPWNIAFDISDLYYLLADYYLKNKEFEKAVEFYVWDLALCPFRFDSWAAIALAKAEEIYSKINSCDRFCIEEITSKAEAVIKCFQAALDLDKANCKVRVEFGSFLYSMHSVYSRELKFHTHQLSLDLFKLIEPKKNEYLLKAQKWFKPYSKYPFNSVEAESEASQIEDVWINHYMLGKVTEKLNPNEPELFLTQYEIAGKLLHAQGAPYPAKINYYSPPEAALEALEIYYRIHASVLSYVERCEDYNELTEELLMSFLQRAIESPFVKSKQGRGVGEGDIKKKKCDEGLSKKETAVISALLKEMIDKVEKIGSKENDSLSESLDSATASADDESSIDESANKLESKPASLPMSSFSLSVVKDKMRESELREETVAEETAAKYAKLEFKESSSAPSKPSETDNLTNNPFYLEFADLKYGKVIAHCLQAMKECVSRYPQCFKAYFRLAYSYKHFKKDFKKAREYFMGNNSTGPKRISGLFGERKPNNFFHGIWRNPVDDIDRPGSFPFHMAKSIQLLLGISVELHDHQLLAEMGVQLARVPDSHNAYLFTDDREQFSKEAISSCSAVAKKCTPLDPAKFLESGTKLYDTYIKFQRHNPRENTIGPVLLQLYKQYAQYQFSHVNTEAISISDAVKFFQHMAWTSKTSSGSQKPNPTSLKNGENSVKSTSDTVKSTVSNLSHNLGTKMSGPKKSLPQRRISDQSRGLENASGNSTFSGQILPQATTNSRLNVGVPSLFAARDFQNMAMALPQFSSDALMAYASQLSSLFSQRASVLEDNTNSLHQQMIQQKQSVALNTSKSNVKDIPEKSQKGEKSQAPRTSPGDTFRMDRQSSANDLISNVSNAIGIQGRTQTKQCELKQNTNLLGHIGKKHLLKTHVPLDISVNPPMSMSSSMSMKRKEPSQGKKIPQMNPIPPLQKLIYPEAESSGKPSSFPMSETNSNSASKSISKLYKGPHQVARKSTCPITGTPRKMYQNVNSRPYMTSSPFQAQTTALMTPNISGLQMKSSKENLTTVGPPPAAHSQASFKPRMSIPSFNEPEVVDLTTKSPEKVPVPLPKKISTPLPQKIPAHLPLKVHAPLPQKTSGSLPQKTPIFQPQKVPLPLAQKIAEMKDRPAKRPLLKTTQEAEKSYPLPPKKKHHLMPSSPQAVPADDNNVEVITIE